MVGYSSDIVTVGRVSSSLSLLKLMTFAAEALNSEETPPRGAQPNWDAKTPKLRLEAPRVG